MMTVTSYLRTWECKEVSPNKIYILSVIHDKNHLHTDQTNGQHGKTFMLSNISQTTEADERPSNDILSHGDSCTINFTSLYSDSHLTGHLVCMPCDIQLTGDEICNSILLGTQGMDTSKSVNLINYTRGITKLIDYIIYPDCTNGKCSRTFKLSKTSQTTTTPLTIEQTVTTAAERYPNGDMSQPDYSKSGETDVSNESLKPSFTLCPTVISILNTCFFTSPKSSEMQSQPLSSTKTTTNIYTKSTATNSPSYSISTSITEACLPCSEIEASTKYTTVVVYSTYHYANNPAKEEERMQYCSGTDSLTPALGGVIGLLIVLLAVAISGYIYIYWHLKNRGKFSARSRQAA